MRGEMTDRLDYAFSEFHGNFLRQDWYMLAKGDYKYTWYAKERPSLFNIARDPLENHDLASDPSKAGILREFEILLRGILDPDEVSLRAKRDLGLIGPDDEDYTETLTFEELRGGIGEGRFPPEGGYAR
jgi:choline-sulfatase